jgi:hypothetical protein
VPLTNRKYAEFSAAVSSPGDVLRGVPLRVHSVGGDQRADQAHVLQKFPELGILGQSRPGSGAAPSASCPPPPAPDSVTRAGPSSSSATPPSRRAASGAPTARPSSTSPAWPRKTQPRTTSSPTSAAAGGWSTPTGYATRSGRRQITHTHRKRTPDLVRPHQPRHHPLPHTRSNRIHRINPPLRPGTPQSPAIPRPDRPLTRLNTTRDFDESPHIRPHKTGADPVPNTGGQWPGPGFD